jgi:nucleoside-diphosphate-sugar epimerase
MKILITGGTGKFGPYLIQHLRDRGHEIRILIHNTEPECRDVEIIKGDVANQEDIIKACKKVDAVCHLATVKGRKDRFLEVNVGGLYNLLEHVRTMDPPPHFFLLSGDNTIGIYDYENPAPMKEDHPYLFVDDEYGLSKILEEVAAFQYMKKYSLPVTILRSSWIMEKNRSIDLCHPRRGGWKSYLTDDLKNRLEKGEEFRVIPHDKFGNSLKRHVVDPRDLADAFICALDNNKSRGNLYNIAGPCPFDYKELAEYMCKKDGQSLYSISTPDAFAFEIDISKAGKMGFKPNYSIFDTVEWALKNSR